MFHLQVCYLPLHLSSFILLMLGLFLYCGILRVHSLVCFFELTSPDSQGWLSLMELASCGQGGNRRRQEVE
jgi:hypothetical protein